RSRFVARVDLLRGDGAGLILIEPFSIELDGDGPLTAYFGFGGLDAHPQLGLLAIERRTREWSIFWRGGKETIAQPPHTRVFGVAIMAGDPRQPALLAIEADGRTISLIGKERWEAIVMGSHSIRRAEASPGKPLFAFADD